MSSVKVQANDNGATGWFAKCVRKLDRSLNGKYYLFDDKTNSEDSPLDVKISSQNITLELNSLLQNENVTKEVKSLKQVG